MGGSREYPYHTRGGISFFLNFDLILLRFAKLLTKIYNTLHYLHHSHYLQHSTIYYVFIHFCTHRTRKRKKEKRGNERTTYYTCTLVTYNNKTGSILEFQGRGGFLGLWISRGGWQKKLLLNWRSDNFASYFNFNRELKHFLSLLQIQNCEVSKYRSCAET